MVAPGPMEWVERHKTALVWVVISGCAPADEVEVGATMEVSTGAVEGSTTGLDASSSTTDEPGSSSSTGTPSFCGDGVVDQDEDCDDGAANAEEGACLPDCVAAECGDGFPQAGVEACDDGNDDDTDACTTACELAACGDGSVQAGVEECDDGSNNGDTRACKTDCTAATCGDGNVYAAQEQCDDGNADNNDGCSELCLFTDCGDGFWNPEINEICDDGTGTPGDSCNDDCLSWGAWTQTFNGAGSSNDLIYGVAFDSAGNPVVAGVTFAAGGDGDDIWVRKYDPSGAEVWTRTVHSVTSDIGYGVAVAPNDDVFVVGSMFTLSDDRDVWMGRFSASGAPGFTRTFNGSSDDTDEGRGIAVDGAGNIGVVGYATQGADTERFIRKYGPSGNTLWTVLESNGTDDEAHGVAFDGAGNLIATGFVTSGGDTDIWIGKYDTGGNESWTRTHDGPAGGNDRGLGVATDADDNVVVVGFEATGGQGDNAWIRKYDASGTEQWTETFNGSADGLDQAQAVAIDAGGDVVVAGSTFGGAQSDNLWLRRYDADGNERYPWATEHNSPGWLSDIANGVAVDDAGNVAVGGFETRSEIGEARNAWLRYVLP